MTRILQKPLPWKPLLQESLMHKSLLNCQVVEHLLKDLCWVRRSVDALGAIRVIRVIREIAVQLY